MRSMIGVVQNILNDKFSIETYMFRRLVHFFPYRAIFGVFVLRQPQVSKHLLMEAFQVAVINQLNSLN